MGERPQVRGLSTNSFNIHSYVIPFEKYGQTIPLVPFGDVHRFSPNCHEQKWLEFVKTIKKERGKAYYLGMGDYDDMYSETERYEMKVAKLHGSSKASLNEYYKNRVKDLTKELLPMKNRIIGLIEGNHFTNLDSGISTTQYMCEQLRCRYLGVSCFIRLIFHHQSTGDRTILDIWAHHGKGASRLHGSSINTVQNMTEAAHAGVYLMGHDHKKGCMFLSRLELVGVTKLRMRSQKIMLGRTGSFLRGYVPGKSSYVAKMGLNPTDLGVIRIMLTPIKEGEDRLIDIHAHI